MRATDVSQHPRTFVICYFQCPGKTYFLTHNKEDLICIIFCRYISPLLRDPAVVRKLYYAVWCFPLKSFIKSSLSYFMEIRTWGYLQSLMLFVYLFHTHSHPSIHTLQSAFSLLRVYLSVLFNVGKNVLNNWKYISRFSQQTEWFLTPEGLCQTSLGMLESPDQLTKKHSNLKNLLSHLESVLPVEE